MLFPQLMSLSWPCPNTVAAFAPLSATVLVAQSSIPRGKALAHRTTRNPHPLEPIVHINTRLLRRTVRATASWTRCSGCCNESLILEVCMKSGQGALCGYCSKSNFVFGCQRLIIACFASCYSLCSMLITTNTSTEKWHQPNIEMPKVMKMQEHNTLRVDRCTNYFSFFMMSSALEFLVAIT